MKTFKIKYYFDGNGEVFVKAKNKEEAENLFFEGEYELKDDSEWGDNYNIEAIEESEKEVKKYNYK